MKRRTFVGSAAAFICSPLSLVRRKCPYRIEHLPTGYNFYNGKMYEGSYNSKDRTFCYRLFDGNETVGWYNRSNRMFITGFEKSVSDFDEKLKQIIPGNYRMRRFDSSVISSYEWLDRNGRVARLHNQGGFVLESPSAVYITIPQDFSPEQAAWKMYEIRKILDA